MSPQYTTPPLTARTITPEWVSDVKMNPFGKKDFSVKILDALGNDLWFNVANVDLWDEFVAGEPVAIQCYKTEAGNWKIKYAQALGAGDPRTNYQDDSGNAKPAPQTVGSNGRNASIEKQTIVKALIGLVGNTGLAEGVGLTQFIIETTERIYNGIFNDAAIIDNKVREIAKALDATVEPDEDQGKNEPDGSEGYAAPPLTGGNDDMSGIDDDIPF